MSKNRHLSAVIERRLQQHKRTANFRNLQHPNLHGVNRESVKIILKTFIRFIMYNLEIDDDLKNCDTLESYIDMYVF